MLYWKFFLKGERFRQVAVPEPGFHRFVLYSVHNTLRDLVRLLLPVELGDQAQGEGDGGADAAAGGDGAVGDYRGDLTDGSGEAVFAARVAGGVFAVQETCMAQNCGRGADGRQFFALWRYALSEAPTADRRLSGSGCRACRREESEDLRLRNPYPQTGGLR